MGIIELIDDLSTLLSEIRYNPKDSWAELNPIWTHGMPETLMPILPDLGGNGVLFWTGATKVIREMRDFSANLISEVKGTKDICVSKWTISKRHNGAIPWDVIPWPLLIRQDSLWVDGLTGCARPIPPKFFGISRLGEPLWASKRLSPCLLPNWRLLVKVSVSSCLVDKLCWKVVMGRMGHPGISVPCTPSAMLEMFKLRHVEPGKRRAALRHWVNGHGRMVGDRAVDVRRHLRGTLKFRLYDDIDAEIITKPEECDELYEKIISTAAISLNDDSGPEQGNGC